MNEKTTPSPDAERNDRLQAIVDADIRRRNRLIWLSVFLLALPLIALLLTLWLPDGLGITSVEGIKKQEVELNAAVRTFDQKADEIRNVIDDATRSQEKIFSVATAVTKSQSEVARLASDVNQTHQQVRDTEEKAKAIVAEIQSTTAAARTEVENLMRSSSAISERAERTLAVANRVNTVSEQAAAKLDDINYSARQEAAERHLREISRSNAEIVQRLARIEDRLNSLDSQTRNNRASIRRLDARVSELHKARVIQ